MMDTLLFSLLAYLLGSVPTAVWVGRKWHGLDVREHGSKNAGATNTFRVLGKKPGVMVLLIDVFKGTLATAIPAMFIPYYEGNAYHIMNIQLMAAVAAVMGHLYPIFAGFRGGKGVATSLGVIIGMQPIAALCCLIVFLSVFIPSKYVSLGAMAAALTFPIFTYFFLDITYFPFVTFAILLCLLVIFAHRKNIERLLKGEENKMNLFKK
jgi:glycerol-3-phosphate acyltransferase PlsY